MPKEHMADARDVSFTSRRGRPTAQQSAAIDRTIREAAVQAFLSDGFEGASMEAIATRAGIPKSTLYKRFPDKRALLRAVLNERVDAWCMAERTHDLGDDLEARLKRLATDILHHAATPEVQAFWGLVSAAWSSPEEAGQRQDVIGYSRMVEGLEQEIRQFGPRSGVVARDPGKVAVALMTMLGGWIEYVAPTAAAPEDEAARFAGAAVDMLMRGTEAW